MHIIGLALFWLSVQAKLAVQFVINYEEGAENCILHDGDTQSEVKSTPWMKER